jgi:2-keto-4-pentenoate hydratase/2-oxohepta-3-ene-1,7-dioic acid hydratase in catechol pathway
VGAFRDPPVSLQAGDVVRMELGGVCELENPVIDE